MADTWVGKDADEKARNTAVTKAYQEIGKVLAKYGFEGHSQGSLYVPKDGMRGKVDMTNIIDMQVELDGMPWFRKCVKDIRVFEILNWSDLTPMFKR